MGRSLGWSLVAGLAIAGAAPSLAFAGPPRAAPGAKQGDAARPDTARAGAARAGAARAGAARAGAGRVEQGLELAKQAAAAYKDGKFEEAIALYQRAHDANPDPISIHNMGRCHEAIGYRKLGETQPGDAAPAALLRVKGDFEAAIDHYERYLTAEPEAATRGVVEQRIRALQAQLKLVDGLAARPAQATAQPRHPLRTAAPWIVVGVGGATLATAFVFSGMAASNETTANDPETSGASSLDAASDATTFATTANVLFAVGGAITLAGGVWAVIDLTAAPAPSEAAATQLRVGPGTVRVSRSF